jgi:hypothetical protein
LYDRVAQSSQEEWQEEQQQLLKRIERDLVEEDFRAVRMAMERLGGEKLVDWYDVQRTNEKESWRGHGLPDLLRAWDWTFKLDLTPAEYRGGGR